MAVYNVGGITPFNRVKTIYEALDRALSDDDVNWRSGAKFDGPLNIKRGINFQANGNRWKVPEHQVGIFLRGSGTLIIENIEISVDALSNGLSIVEWNGTIIIRNSSIAHRPKIKNGKAYPTIMSGEGAYNLVIEDSIVDGANLYSQGSIVIKNSKILGTNVDGTIRASSIEIIESELSNVGIEAGDLDITNSSINESFASKHEVGIFAGIAAGLRNTAIRLTGDSRLEEVDFGNGVSTLELNDGKFVIDGVTIESAEVTSRSVDIEVQGEFVDFGHWTKENTTVSNQTEGELTHETEDSAVDEMNKLIGLESVKAKMEEYTAMARVSRAREAAGLKTMNYSLHLVFAGSPGTGKTTIAEIFAKALYEEGILPSSKVNIVGREDLIDKIIGGTAIKTKKVIEDSLGGVLFVDEAYSLRSSGDKDFANEAVDVLVKEMDAHRDNLVVILAGYTDEMKDFFEKGNPGLKSRFTNWVEFPDYSFEELWQIMHLNLSSDFDPSVEALDKAKAYLFSLYRKDLIEGNARFIRNFVQEISFAQNLRVSREGDFSEQALRAVKAEDVSAGYSKVIATIESRKV